MRRLVPARALTRLAPLALTLLSGCGCGSEVTPTAALASERLTLGSESGRDGWVAQGGLAVTQSTLATLPGTGDFGQGAQSRRQFLSFDLAPLPAGTTVQSAVLSVYQARVDGTPYASHGVVVVDHLVYGTLDSADYDRPAMTSALGTLSSSPSLALRVLDLTSAVQADLAAGRTRTQVRLRWNALDRNGDATDDQACFADADDALGTGLPPRLLLTYSSP